MSSLHEAKPFIVAEIGSNWQTLEHCLASIREAKYAGADAAKFQAYDHHALYGSGDGYRDGATPMAGVLRLEWLPELAKEACRIGAELMITAFSPELVLAVDPYVSVHKVASSDLCYPQLLEAIAKTGKPVLLSTGAAMPGDLEKAMTFFRPGLAMPLYCVAAYPAAYADLEMVGRFIGFSDHTLGYTAAVQAARFGAPVIEKHVTFFPELDTPDRPHSLTGEEFKAMVDLIRGTSQPHGPLPEERAMTLRHRRRLVATQDIAIGDKLVYGENYGAYRSLEDDDHGLTPFLWNHKDWGPEGKTARQAITKGKGVGPGDF